MRRLAFAAVCGSLVLAACSDQNPSPTEPSVPAPEQTFGTTCDHGRYPLRNVALLIPAAFPTRALRTEALVRVGAIALLWDFCRDRLARQAALKTIAWIDSKVTSPQAEALKAAILNGFGGTSTPVEDFVSGVYVPGTTMVFTTFGGRATLELRPGAFLIPTLITIRRLSDEFRLGGFPEERQRPPFWDYDATNSSTDNTVATHTLATPGTATMAFCFVPPDADYGFPGARIGHNPVGGGFELVLDTEVPANLGAALTDCAPPVIGSAGGGLSELANFTWSNAGHYLARVARTLFLPAPLRAATVGPRGPIAGLPSNLSPFGLVLPDCPGDGYYSYFCLDGGID